MTMIRSKRWISRLIVSTVAVTAPTLAPGQEEPAATNQRRLFLQAGSMLITTGELSETDEVMDDGTRFDTYTIRLPAGNCEIEMRSEAFDAYLIVYAEGKRGWRIENDDGGWTGNHARIEGRVETFIDAVVIANAYVSEAQGAYEIVLRSRPEDPRPLLPMAVVSEVANLEGRAERIERQFLDGETDSLDEAVTAATRALSLRREHQRRDWWEVIDAEQRLADLRSLSGFGLLQQVGLAEARRLNSVGIEARDNANYQAARRAHERSLAIREHVLGPDHPDTAVSLNNLGVVMNDLGEFESARPVHERALKIRRQVLGPDHPDTALSLNNLGYMLNGIGDFENARQVNERALAIRERVLGPDHPDTALSLNNLAFLLKSLGDFEGARQMYERALAIREQVLGPNHSDTALSVNNVARVLEDLGDYEAARPRYERTLAIRERTLGPDHPDTAASLHSLAGLLQTLGENEAAQQLYERALEIREQVFGRDHPNTAVNLNDLAYLFRSVGDYEAAREMYERALAIREKMWGSDHPLTASIASNLLALLIDLGDHEAMLRHLEGSNPGAYLTSMLRAQTERERFNYLETQRWHVELALAAARAVGSPEAAVLGYDRVLGWSGEASRVARSSRGGAMTDEQRGLLEQLRDVQGQISRLFYASDREQRETALPALLDERQRLELTLNRTLTRQQRAVPSLSLLAGSVPEGAAAIDFLVHDVFLPATRQDGEIVEAGRWSGRRVSAWVTRRGDAAPTWLDLGPADELQSAVQRFLEDLVAVRGVQIEADGPTPNDALRAVLWEPLAPHLDSVDRLIVSPDGFLGTLPLETIQLSDGQFLLERYPITYMQDVSALAGIGEDRPRQHESLLAVGNVDFNRREVAADAGDDAPSPVTSPVAVLAQRGGFQDFWQRLEGTAQEAQTVEDLHGLVFPDGVRHAMRGAEPVEERLKPALEQADVLHLATHGFFEPEGLPSMREEVHRGDERHFQLRESERRLVGYHPGLLSGLVCAGANLPADGGRDDGYLTAEEIGWLDLSGADLVVLSACETGLGRPRSGEGLLGLRRAILTAGARTVVSSLWSVRDQSTSQLMQAFYTNMWRRDMPTHEALREAQLAMLHANLAGPGGDPRPSTWGAFVLDGDWR